MGSGNKCPYLYTPPPAYLLVEVGGAYHLDEEQCHAFDAEANPVACSLNVEGNGCNENDGCSDLGNNAFSFSPAAAQQYALTYELTSPGCGRTVSYHVIVQGTASPANHPPLIQPSPWPHLTCYLSLPYQHLISLSDPDAADTHTLTLSLDPDRSCVTLVGSTL